MNNEQISWVKSASQFCVAISVIGFGVPAVAQIVPDTTLRAENSRVTPNVRVRGTSSDLIEGGAVRGSNLFQSFLEFNVRNGQRVYFANPIGVQNIFSRITGVNASNILGTLGVDGGANLFLLNPNGILFGPNAQLDIRGSFLATTANSFKFSDGNSFGATNPQAAPLLTMSAPVGVQYGANATGTIQNRGNLTVGQDLTLAANHLDLQGQLQAGRDLNLQAQDTVQIRDSVAQPFIAAAGSRLLVQGDRAVDIFALNHLSSGFFSGSDLILRANTVGGDAHFQSGGNLRIEQADGTAGNLFSPHDPVILAAGDVSLGDYTGASLHILAGGSVTLGNVKITGSGTADDTINPDNPDPFLASLATVQLSNGEKISIDGREPTLDVRAGIDWSQFPNFPGNAGIGVLTPPTAPATGANIVLSSVNFDSDFGGTVLLSNQYAPNRFLPAPSEISVGAIDTGGDLEGGSIFIDAREHLTTHNRLITTAFSANGSSGDVLLRAGGDIQLMDEIDASSVDEANADELLGTSGSVDLWAGGSITLSPGANILVKGSVSGDVTLRGKGNISISDSVIDSASANSDPNLNFSQVQIESLSGSVFLSDVMINTENMGSEFAGDLFINASNRIEIANSTISGDGNFGRIFIGSSLKDDSLNPQTIVVENSKLTTTNEVIQGMQDAGIIVISATGNTSIRSSTLSGATTGTGRGGGIVIATGSLLLEQSNLNVETRGSGAAGGIFIGAQDQIALTGGQISNNLGAGAAVAIGEPGTITIEAGALSITQGGVISSSVNPADPTNNLPAAKGNAGTIDLQIAGQTSLSGANSRIRTVIGAGAQGNGGKITLKTGSLTLENSAAISASTLGTGNAGQISITAQNDILLQQSGRISSAVRSGAKGNAGTIKLASGGSISLTGNSEIEAVVESQAQGNGGNLFLNARSFTALGGGRINASTSGQGNAGTISVTLSDGALLDGIGGSGKFSGLSSTVSETANGRGGDISLTAPNITLRNGARITADSKAIEGARLAGNLTLSANVLKLDNNAFITAETAGGGGGDIQITATDLLLLRRNSGISTTAGTPASGGNGGNIRIAAPKGFVIAVPSENSDIIANAFGGKGGAIEISANRVFGLQKRDRLSPAQLLEIRRNGNSDISASSDRGLDGQISISTLQIDPSQGLAEIPVDLIDSSSLIAQGCQPGNAAIANRRSEFVITGRGGLPPGPSGVQTNSEVSIPWVSQGVPVAQVDRRRDEIVEKPASELGLVEAQGIAIAPNGSAFLTAQAATATSAQSGFSAATCPRQ